MLPVIDIQADLSPGLLFSTIVMLAIAAISLWAFLMLTSTYNVVPGSFGGEPCLSSLVDVS